MTRPPNKWFPLTILNVIQTLLRCGPQWDPCVCAHETYDSIMEYETMLFRFLVCVCEKMKKPIQRVYMFVLLRKFETIYCCENLIRYPVAKIWNDIPLGNVLSRKTISEFINLNSICYQKFILHLGKVEVLKDLHFIILGKVEINLPYWQAQNDSILLWDQESENQSWKWQPISKRHLLLIGKRLLIIGNFAVYQWGFRISFFRLRPRR